MNLDAQAVQDFIASLQAAGDGACRVSRAAQRRRMQRDSELSEQLMLWRQDLVQRGLSTAQPTLPLDEDAYATSGIGNRVAPVEGASSDHKGIDFVPVDARGTTRVLAPMSGRVLFTGPWSAQLGQSVFIGGDDGNIYVVGHLQGRPTHRNSSITVNVGDRVEQGEVLGIMGRTGRVSAAHVHFVVRRPEFMMLSSAPTPEPAPTENDRVTQVASRVQLPLESNLVYDRDFEIAEPYLNGNHMPIRQRISEGSTFEIRPLLEQPGEGEDVGGDEVDIAALYEYLTGVEVSGGDDMDEIQLQVDEMLMQQRGREGHEVP